MQPQTASDLTNHNAKSELDDDELDDLKKKIQIMQSGTVERKIGIRKG